MRELDVVRFFTLFLVTASVLALANPMMAQNRPRVVAVNHALQYLGDRLLGGAAEVIFPVPEGVDPSFWRPSIADISRVQSADLILLNGAAFATWIDRVSLPRSRLVNTSAAIKDQFIVTQSITHSHGDGGEHSHEGLASYLWLDPMLALEQAKAIAVAIVARDLATQNDVDARLAKLRSDLTNLDETVQKAMSDLNGIEIIATHPRYQYFARRYGVSITSLEWEAGAAPTPEQLTELEQVATQKGARILIWEAQPPREAIEAIEALGLQSVLFEPGASLGTQGTFLKAYETAVLAIAKAVADSKS